MQWSGWEQRLGAVAVLFLLLALRSATEPWRAGLRAKHCHCIQSRMDLAQVIIVVTVPFGLTPEACSFSKRNIVLQFLCNDPLHISQDCWPTTSW